MNKKQRREYLVSLDENLLQGGVVLSEWCVFIVRDADAAFVNEAYLASILTGVSAIETHLRFEYGGSEKDSLYNLIETSIIDPSLKKELHKLRRYRNKWVHISAPGEDDAILKNPGTFESELEKMAASSVRTLRKVLYINQCV